MSDKPSSRDAQAPVPAAKPEKPGSDVVLIRGVTDDGKGLEVLRARDERLEIGQVRPLEEGKPLAGDVVRLLPRPDAPYLCDVETQVRVPTPGASRDVSRVPQSGEPQGFPGAERRVAKEAAAEHRPLRSGPPQVATDAYRKNWDAIWSTRDKGRDLPN